MEHALNLNVVSRRVEAVNRQLLKQPEFQKILNQIVTKSASDREGFAQSLLAVEALTKLGINVPKGAKIEFKPSTNKELPKKKRMVINLAIPGVGNLFIRAGINDKPAKK